MVIMVFTIITIFVVILIVIILNVLTMAVLVYRTLVTSEGQLSIDYTPFALCPKIMRITMLMAMMMTMLMIRERNG